MTDKEMLELAAKLLGLNTVGNTFLTTTKVVHLRSGIGIHLPVMVMPSGWR